MRRIALNLVRYGASYRASSSDEWECIGGLEPAPWNATVRAPPPPATRRVLFSEAQVDAALDLLQTNELNALKRGDFSAFGKQVSWVKLADGVVERLATDLLELKGVQDVKERADLLRRRLEARRATKGARTPSRTQAAILVLHAASVGVHDLETLSGGSLVRDVDGALGRLSVIMRSWRDVASLAPHTTPRTEDVVRMVKSAIDTVLQSNVSEGTKAHARRVWAQWCPAPRSAQGTRVQWDSD